ncbi:vWA domain-containing protein [Gemmobacter serpentinus]|uniref:vWA domain-containing protein n=1 Tax=Gemmobacter serpentinus TaxID=2652247 RepID=UPI001CF69F4F|nr:von Willebrand factor type A domain-containing protein [Gemmobacter serpentinus]
MTDELDRLKAGLRKAPPAPDRAAREAALSAALQSFDKIHDAPQGSADAPRPMPERPKKSGGIAGVLDMLKSLSPARVLAGTTSVVALTVAVIAIAPGLREGPPKPQMPETLGVSSTDPAMVPPSDAPGEQADAQANATTADATAADAARADAQNSPMQKAAEAAPAGAAVDQDGGSVAPRVAQEQAAPVAPAKDMAAAEPMAESYGAAADMTIAENEAPPLAAPAPSGARLRKELGGARNGVAMGNQAAPAASEAVAPDAYRAPMQSPSTEAFANADANPVKAVDAAPVSTFSVDVDTASYAMVRQSLESGYPPVKESIRIEEMVNYFPYAYPQPEGDQPFRPDVTVFQTPWNPGTRLVRIGLQGRSAEVAQRPPLNLVFLVDTSGSMDQPNKLPLLQQALRLVLPQLTAEDQVAIVSYAGSAGVALPPTKATEVAKIGAALDNLRAGGGTAGEEGLQAAYRLAAEMRKDGEVSRVLLATDGDFNLGLSDPEALTDYIATQRKSGTYLSVLGFGRGNLDDAVMQALAQNGNGLAAYIDTAQEARKVLVDQLSGALFPLADDVKVQVEWNPAEVAEYRLIGYETRALAREDFNNDRVDAGEIGSGLQVTALYEVTAPDSAARLTEPLRYGAAPVAGETGELGFLRLRWKAPGASESQLIEAPIPAAETAPDSEARFASAIAGFGQLLTGSTYLGDWGWDEAIKLAEGARGEDPFGYRIEAVNLMRLAKVMQP